jgi:hypothetical protein
MGTGRIGEVIVKRIRRTFEVAGLAAILAFAMNPPATAAGLRVDPSIALEERWDSNVLNTSGDKRSDFVFRARPALTAFITAFETTTSISGGFEFERYADNSELDDETAAVDLRLSTLKPLRFTPRFSLSPSAKLVETKDTARRTQLLTAAEPTPEILPVETVVTARTRSRDYGASLTAHYLVTPRTDLSLGGRWFRRDFLGDVTAFDAENSRTVSGDAALAYRVTPRLSSGVFFNAGRHTFERSPNARMYTAGVTGSYALAQHYSVTARAGASYLKEDADASGRENTESSPSGSLAVTYSWETFKATAMGSYDLAGGGSFGQTTKRGTVGLTVTNQFAARWWGDLAVRYQTNRSPGDAANVDIDTVQGAAGIRYTAAKWASFRLSGDILRQRSAGLEGEDIDRETVVLGVDLTTSYLLF